MSKRPRRKLVPKISSKAFDAAADAALATLGGNDRADMLYDWYRSQVRSAIVRYSGNVGDISEIDSEVSRHEDRVKEISRALRIIKAETHRAKTYGDDLERLKITQQCLTDICAESEDVIERLSYLRSRVTKSKGSDPQRDLLVYELLRIYAQTQGKPVDRIRINKNYAAKGSAGAFIGAAMEKVFGFYETPANLRNSVERVRASNSERLS